MKVAVHQEHLTVTRFPGGEGRQRKVYFDRIAGCLVNGSGRLTLALDDGEELRLNGLRRDAAVRLAGEVNAVLADVAADRDVLPDLGALGARVAAVLDAPGYSPGRLVDLLALNAVRSEASDLHLEPRGDDVLVLLRRHGTLYPVAQLPADAYRRVLATLKLRAELPSYRHDIAQEGRLAVMVDGQHVDLRLSVLPTVAGEKANLRVFDPRVRTLGLSDLGFAGPVTEGLRELLQRRSGLLLITGPSGSGKTTTAYALLREVLRRDGDRARVAAVEDPVEAVVAGVQQVAVNEREELTYEKVISHLLRQDADVLLIGEIRDRETARAAVQAALTGHLVVSTLHCASSAEAFQRLLDLGLSRERVADTVVAVLAQRLVRLECRRADHGADSCPGCLGTGYDGRAALAELLRVSPSVASALRNKRATPELARLAAEDGLEPLATVAARWVEAGRTSREEAERCVR